MTAYGTEFFSIVHRPLETDDDLTAFFTWREPRRVSKSLTVQYDKVLYLIEDNELSRRAIGKYIVAIAWLLSKSVITAPIIGATKPEHLSTAISALDFSLSDAEITELEARYLPHPVDGIIPPLPDTPPSLTPPSAIQNY